MTCSSLLRMVYKNHDTSFASLFGFLFPDLEYTTQPQMDVTKYIERKWSSWLLPFLGNMPEDIVMSFWCCIFSSFHLTLDKLVLSPQVVNQELALDVAGTFAFMFCAVFVPAKVESATVRFMVTPILFS